MNRFWLILRHSFRRTYTANICGHKTKQEGHMSNGENMTNMKMPLAENGNPDYCLECIGDMSIKCAWCGKPITIGSPVTLYTPKEEFEIPEHAVHYTKNDSKALVGCSGRGCAIPGFDICGKWMPPGEVKRLPSPVELCIATKQGVEENMVIVFDKANYPARYLLTQ